MKKLQALFVGIVAIIAILTFTAHHLARTSGQAGRDTLTIYNWGDYIDPDLIKKFEEEYHVKVIYETFDSNEAMLTKIQQGGTNYDIAIPSDYMIQKMISENLLIKLDHSKITGLDNIGSYFLDQPFDPKNAYSIPYFWGTLGIVYNEDMVEAPLVHWDDLWKEEYENNILLIDGAREVMGFALNSLGYSLNSTNMDELHEAVDKLKLLTPNVKAIIGDEIKMYMAQEEAAIAVTFSGEAAEMMDENDSLHYVIPPEGSNLWFDNMVIPSTARNVDAAYDFINFMLIPENAAQNAEYVGYATPNDKAKALLPEEISSDEAFYPSPEVISHLEVYEDLGKEMLGIYNDLFLQFKMFRN